MIIKRKTKTKKASPSKVNKVNKEASLSKDVPDSALIENEQSKVSQLKAIFDGKVFFSISRSISRSNTSGEVRHNNWQVDVLGLSRENELMRERVVSNASYSLARARLGRLMKVLTFAAIKQQQIDIEALVKPQDWTAC